MADTRELCVWRRDVLGGRGLVVPSADVYAGEQLQLLIHDLL